VTDLSPRRKLADRLGILSGFSDTDEVYRDTSEDTRIRLLSALGIDAETEATAQASLDRLEADDAARLVDPVAVVSVLAPAAREVPLGTGAGGDLEWTLAITAEDGRTRTLEGKGGPIPLPDLTPGYYSLRVRGALGGS